MTAALRGHRAVVAIALLVAVAVLALLAGTRSLGNTSPGTATRAVPEIAAQSAVDRDVAVTVFSLRCLDALSKAKPREAIGFCDLALTADPGNVDALNLRGNAYALAGDGARAIGDFSRAIALRPEDARAYRFRGAVYALQQRDRAALADYDRAMTLVPNDAATLELRGHLHQARGRYARALADFTAVLQQQPRLARVWNSRCWTRVLANSGMGAALKDCDTSILLDRNAANAHDSRGFVLVRIGRFREAIGSFDVALKLNPRLASSYFGRGVAKLSLHNAGGQRDIARAKQIEPDIEVRFYGYGFKVPASGPSGT